MVPVSGCLPGSSAFKIAGFMVAANISFGYIAVILIA
jgi:hypothetical protein